MTRFKAQNVAYRSDIAMGKNLPSFLRRDRGWFCGSVDLKFNSVSNSESLTNHP